MYCTKCGNKINTGEKYCKHCGNLISQERSKKKVEQKKDPITNKSNDIKKNNTDEEILYQQNGARCWYKINPGFLKLGSKSGKLLLTNKRLIFLSSGSMITSAEIVGQVAGGIVGQMIGGSTVGNKLSLDDLSRNGSWFIFLHNIHSCSAQKNLNYPYYLSISGEDENEEHCDYSIVFANWMKKQNWHVFINEALEKRKI